MMRNMKGISNDGQFGACIAGKSLAAHFPQHGAEEPRFGVKGSGQVLGPPKSLRPTYF